MGQVTSHENGIMSFPEKLAIGATRSPKTRELSGSWAVCVTGLPGPASATDPEQKREPPRPVRQPLAHAQSRQFLE